MPRRCAIGIVNHDGVGFSALDEGLEVLLPARCHPARSSLGELVERRLSGFDSSA
jgi:hypothetical protein